MEEVRRGLSVLGTQLSQNKEKKTGSLETYKEELPKVGSNGRWELEFDVPVEPLIGHSWQVVSHDGQVLRQVTGAGKQN